MATGFQARASAAKAPHSIYNPLVDSGKHLQHVRALLSKYEHPLMDFSAVEHGDGIQIVIQAKNVTVPVHTYTIDLHPRDLESPQLQWTLERQIYDGLHDYIIEMFTHAAHTRDW